MRQDDQRPEITESEESTIFSAHQTSAKLREEQKQQKRDDRQAMIAEMKERNRNTRTVTIVMSVLLTMIVIVCGLIVTLSLWPKSDERDMSKGYFLGDTTPPMDPQEVNMELVEAFYTNDGSLSIEVQFSNGSDVDKLLRGFDFTVTNNLDQVVASVKQSPDWKGDFVLPAKEYTNLVVIIPSENVKLKDDSLYILTVEYSLDTPARTY